MDMKTESAVAVPEAYIYAHRNSRIPDSPIKVGYHTGDLKRLWSRYKIYNGSTQEFKAIAVKEKEARWFERSIQLLLEREGLWIENELFLSNAWDAFDRVVRPFTLPKHCILHVFKRSSTTAISHTISDEEFDVEDLPTMRIELSTAKKRRTEDDGSLPFSELITAVWQYLSRHEFVRDPATGDIYGRTYINHYSFERKFTLLEFVTFVYRWPQRFGLSRSPRDAHATQLGVVLRKNPSAIAPFLTFAADSYGFMDGILDLSTMVFRVAEDISVERVMTSRTSHLNYSDAFKLPSPSLDVFLRNTFDVDMIDRFLFALGQTICHTYSPETFTIVVESTASVQINTLTLLLRAIHDEVTILPQSLHAITGVILLDQSRKLITTSKHPILGITTPREARDREILIPMHNVSQDMTWVESENLQLVLRSMSVYALRNNSTFSLVPWFTPPE